MTGRVWRKIALGIIGVQLFVIPLTAYPRTLEAERRFHIIHRIRIHNQVSSAYEISARIATINWVTHPSYQVITDIKSNPAVHWRRDGEYIEIAIDRLDPAEQRVYEVQTTIHHATVFDDPLNLESYNENLSRFAHFLSAEEGMPVGDPILKRINSSIFANNDTPKTKARKIFAYVNHNLTYKLDKSRKADVFNALRSGWGRCEDFAMVFVALCRTAGIPSRLVTGFRINPAELNDANYIDITENLHMWAEIYLPGTGWVSVEPTYDSRVNGEKNIDYRFFAGFYPNDLHIYLWYGRKSWNIRYKYDGVEPRIQGEETYLIKPLP